MTCSVETCKKPLFAAGLCNAHYGRKWRNGDPLAGRATPYDWPANLLHKLIFMPPTTLPTGCIEFGGSRLPKGYGRLRKHGKVVLTHRAMYELVVGPIPKGADLDHLCHNTSCCNPGHLEPVSRSENLRRRRVRPEVA